MVTHNPHEDVPQVENEAHQHAFVLVGNKQLFGVHMTQYHCELHKYQVILKLKLPDAVYAEFIRLRQNNPQDTFVLCNAKDPKHEILPPDVYRSFSIPDIGSGRVDHFTANIFQGIRPLSPQEIAADSHFFPWGKNTRMPLSVNSKFRSSASCCSGLSIICNNSPSMRAISSSVTINRVKPT